VDCDLEAEWRSEGGRKRTGNRMAEGKQAEHIASSHREGSAAAYVEAHSKGDQDEKVRENRCSRGSPSSVSIAFGGAD